MNDIDPKFKTFLKRLRRWKGVTLDLPYRSSHDGKRAKKYKDAQVFSSVLEGSESFFDPPRHALILDIDYPVYVIPSSTEDHSHIYFDVPKGIDQRAWKKLMRALGDAGVIERGYADSAELMGESLLRAPWVKKPPPPPVAEFPW